MSQNVGGLFLGGHQGYCSSLESILGLSCSHLCKLPGIHLLLGGGAVGQRQGSKGHGNSAVLAAGFIRATVSKTTGPPDFGSSLTRV